MRHLLPALLAGLLCNAQPVFAQALPDSVRAAGVTVAQWQAVQVEVRRAAAARGASERALAAVAERVSANLVVNGRIDLDQVLASISERAQQVAELQTQLAAMQRVDDPAVAALLSQASTAINAGDLTQADQLLAQAAQSDLAGIALEEARTATRRTRAAQTMAERGRLANASADYLSAAAHYAQAAETAPEADAETRWTYRMQQATAQFERGRLFGDSDPLREAVRLYRHDALPMVPRATRPSDWAMTQHNLAVALQALGELGDNDALSEAIAACRAALEVYTRATAPMNWALTQNTLGNALRVIGDRTDDDAQVRQAIAAYRAALEVRTRSDEPAEWAGIMNNLGNAQSGLGVRGDDQALRDAVATYRAALEVYTQTTTPSGWAMTQNNLGTALRQLGARGDKAALNEAVVAYRAALQIYTRESAPANWAGTQFNLGVVLYEIGKHGDRVVLRDAVVAHQAALQVYTRASAPAHWGKTQYSLGAVLFVLGRLGDVTALQDAIAAYQASLEVHTRTTAPTEWAAAQFGLSLVYANQGDSAAALEAARFALEGYEQVHNEHESARTRRLIAELEEMQ